MHCSLLIFSSSPSFILVTVTPKLEDGWRGVVTSLDFRRALQIDNGWVGGFFPNYYKQLVAELDSLHTLVIAPVSPEAVDALRLVYTPEDLKEAREFLSRFSDSEIHDELSGFDWDQGGRIRRFYSDRSRPDVHQAALAHALIERGFLPKRGDYVPAIYVVDRWCDADAV